MRKKISVLVVILSIVAVILSWMGIGVYSSGSAVRDMNETQKLMLVKEDIDKSSMKEKVWLEQDIIDMFYSMTNGEAELEYLDCTLMPDRACERIGAVLYKNTEEGVIEVAFFDERGYAQQCGVYAEAADSSELIYLGDGTVSFQLKSDEGDIYNCKINIFIKDSNVAFVVEDDLYE